MTASRETDKNDALGAWRRALEATAPIASQPGRTLPLVIADMAATRGSAPALIGRDQSLTFDQLGEQSSRWSRWALSEGLDNGGVVSLLMPNCPEYMAIWLGITRVGGVVALINTNLSGGALAHCIRAAEGGGRRAAGEHRPASHVIAGPGLGLALASARPHLDPAMRCWYHGVDGEGQPRIDRIVEALPGTPLVAAGQRPVTTSDRALLIYTSGTTGLPKAAHVSHGRLMQWSHWFAGLMDTKPDDRMYDCLPMYHAIGGVVATGALLVNGGSVVVADRFSASRFWDDVLEWDCTMFQYIGELCRYLVASPPHLREANHRLRIACGNGLSAAVWPAFEQRFRIPRILEYYAATEASFSLYNCEGKPGAIGRIPPFLKHRFQVVIVRHDQDTGEPVRGPDGLCIKCGVEEAGEALGLVAGSGGASGGGRFEGYTDEAASRAKIVRDVLQPGDAWYRTGDLMRRDAKGFFRFVDRVGDTFRWKGENVSTTEVAAAIGACQGIAEAVVYGVTVPGTEGRAGMAAIVPGEDFDLDALRRHLVERLPPYARPVFLRLLPRIETTSTFRPVKAALARDGFDPAQVADALLLDDPATQAYVTLDETVLRRIVSGEVRL